MNLQEYFSNARKLIANHDFETLAELPLQEPEQFNWAADIFEGINLQEHPDQEALIWTDGSREERYSFQDVADWGSRLLNFLRRHGVEQGDSLFLQLPLIPINWITYFTGIKGGFVLIPAATVLEAADIVFRFQTLLPKVVIADSANAPKIDEAEQELGRKVPLKIITDGERDGWQSISAIDTEEPEAEPATTKPHDALFLFFTSGTTGMPKVVTHTHLSYPLGHLTTASWIGLQQGDVHYNISQPGWAKFAWSCFFAPWNAGATVFAFNPPGRFDAKEQLTQIAKQQVTTFCAPPTALRMLIQEDLQEFDFSFRECVAAGEPLTPEIIEAWRKGTGLVIRDGYGQTESTALVANLPGQEIKFGSMGRPTFLYDIVIANDEGEEMPVNEEGNICVRTDSDRPNGLFRQYFGEPERKKEVYRKDLYYTGDKAYKDEDGYIWFVGRDDDVIKSSDYRIGPFEVESVLSEHEAVVESAVVASPHELRGALVKAFIVTGSNYAPSQELAEDIYQFSRNNLASYKIPRIIEFVDELPKTISGKIRRVELRAAEAMSKAKNEEREQEYRFA